VRLDVRVQPRRAAGEARELGQVGRGHVRVVVVVAVVAREGVVLQQRGQERWHHVQRVRVVVVRRPRVRVVGRVLLGAGALGEHPAHHPLILHACHTNHQIKHLH